MTPEIISPLSGARFISSANEREDIGLRWKKIPHGLRPEINLKRLDDPEFSTYLDPTPSGVVVSLPDGFYSWKVRTVNHKNRRSDWSSVQEFSIQENVRGAAPIAVFATPHSAPGFVSGSIQRKIAQEAETSRIEEARRIREEMKKESEKTVRANAQKRAKQLAEKQLNLQNLSAQNTHWRLQKYSQVREAAELRVDAILEDTQSIKAYSKASLVADESEESSNLSVLIRWAPVYQVARYTLTLFELGKPLQTLESGSAQYALPLQTLLNKKDLSFQVAANLSNGQKLESKITPVHLNIEAPHLANPAESSDQEIRLPILFSWNKINYVKGYEFQLSKDSEFKSVIHQNKTQEALAAVTLNQSGDYFWRVRGQMEQFPGEWSLPRKLHVR